MSISIGPLTLYIASFVATIAVKRINKLVGEKVGHWNVEWNLTQNGIGTYAKLAISYLLK